MVEAWSPKDFGVIELFATPTTPPVFPQIANKLGIDHLFWLCLHRYRREPPLTIRCSNGGGVRGHCTYEIEWRNDVNEQGQTYR